jgi:crossover junction endodeoxyribonuclease RusA
MTDFEFTLFVPGRPAPQGSKRHVGGGRLVESSKAVAPWRTSVAWHAAQAWRDAPMDGPLRVRLEFVMPRPASAPKRSTPPAIRRPDTDKLVRAVFDALSGVCWRDDSLVVDLHASKRIAEIGEQPGALIEISPQIAVDKILCGGQTTTLVSNENAPALSTAPAIGMLDPAGAA